MGISAGWDKLKLIYKLKVMDSTKLLEFIEREVNEWTNVNEIFQSRLTGRPKHITSMALQLKCTFHNPFTFAYRINHFLNKLFKCINK